MVKTVAIRTTKHSQCWLPLSFSDGATLGARRGEAFTLHVQRDLTLTQFSPTRH